MATAGLHVALAGITAGSIVSTGNELVREPTVGHAAMFALAAAPVGKLEKLSHAVVSSTAADWVMAYAGKAVPVVSDAIKALPGMTKGLEAAGTVAKAIKGSEAAVKVAEVTGEVMEHNGAHLVHHAVTTVAEHSGGEGALEAKNIEVSYHMDMVETR